MTRLRRARGARRRPKRERIAPRGALPMAAAGGAPGPRPGGAPPARGRVSAPGATSRGPGARRGRPGRGTRGPGLGRVPGPGRIPGQHSPTGSRRAHRSGARPGGRAHAPGARAGRVAGSLARGRIRGGRTHAGTGRTPRVAAPGRLPHRPPLGGTSRARAHAGPLRAWGPESRARAPDPGGAGGTRGRAPGARAHAGPGHTRRPPLGGEPPARAHAGPLRARDPGPRADPGTPGVPGRGRGAGVPVPRDDAGGRSGCGTRDCGRDPEARPGAPGSRARAHAARGSARPTPAAPTARGGPGAGATAGAASVARRADAGAGAMPVPGRCRSRCRAASRRVAGTPLGGLRRYGRPEPRRWLRGQASPGLAAQTRQAARPQGAGAFPLPPRNIRVRTEARAFRAGPQAGGRAGAGAPRPAGAGQGGGSGLMVRGWGRAARRHGGERVADASRKRR